MDRDAKPETMDDSRNRCSYRDLRAYGVARIATGKVVEPRRSLCLRSRDSRPEYITSRFITVYA